MVCVGEDREGGGVGVWRGGVGGGQKSRFNWSVLLVVSSESRRGCVYGLCWGGWEGGNEWEGEGAEIEV